MKYNEIKTAKGVDLPGVTVEFETAGSVLEAIHFRTGDKSFRIRRGSDYSRAVEISERTEFEKEDRWVVKGKMHGIDVLEYYKDHREADKRYSELARHGEFEDIHSVDVLVDGNGTVVKVLASD